MCDSFWEPLVEIYIVEREQVNDRSAYYRCLCSRVRFGHTEICTSLASEDDSEEESINGECVEEILDVYDESMIETQSLEKHDEEPVSCYCSASHTDNNYSTDEHDSVRDSAHRPTAHSLTQRLGLHQSDSGADLSEYHDQHEEKNMQHPSMPHEETFQVAETEIGNDRKNANMTTGQIEYKHLSDNNVEDAEIARNNLFGTKDECFTEDLTLFASDNQKSVAQNLSEDTAHDDDDGTFMQYDYEACAYPYSAFYESNKSAIDIAWEQYWAKNGEQLIWTSWIEKYANYINPDYFQSDVTNGDEKPQNAEVIHVAVEKFYENNGCFQNEANEDSELTHSNLAGNFDKGNLSDEQLQPATSSNNLSFDQCIREENIPENNEETKNESYLEAPSDNGASEGWNLLGTEESYNQYSNTENERLLTRCDSINGSIAKTNVTSDSMTNVTKMTLTSSSYNSNSSSLATSFESPSHGSDTTNSASDSEEEQELAENDKYWQRLWKEHFELRYREEYERFVLQFTKAHSTDQVSDQYRSHASDRSDEQEAERVSLSTSRRVSSSEKKSISKNTRSSRSEKHRKEILIIKSVGALLNNLSLSNTSSSSLRDDTSEENPGEMAYVIPHRSYQIKRGLKQVKEGLSLIDFHFDEDCEEDWHGEIVFRKRNIIWKQPTKYKRLRNIGSSSNAPEQKENVDPQKMPQSSSASTSDTDGALDSLPASPFMIRKCDQDSWLGDESDWDDDDHIISHSLTELDGNLEGDASQRREQRRSKRRVGNSDFLQAPADIRGDPEMKRYWLNRYELFSKYDEGIQMDKESWYSVTPERIARHIAKRCSCRVIIDGFCGAGGNSIQFAFTCDKVIAIDIDPRKVAMARNNARIYGVEHKIQFIVGDYFDVVPTLEADIVYLSPPWGGPRYGKTRVFNLKDIMPRHGNIIFNVARQVTENVAYFLPKNVNIKEILFLSGRSNVVETEQYMEAEKHVALTCYFGDLASNLGSNNT